MDNKKLQSAEKFSFATLGTIIFTALFIYLLEIIFVVAFTALIYSGELASQIPRAFGFILAGDAVLCLVIACLSSYRGVIGIQQDIPGAMLSVAAAGVIAALSGSVSHQFATVTIMVVLTSMMTGILLMLVGVFKLGGLARFLPYPIVGGFLAGTGWLLVQGGIGLILNTSFSVEWFQGDMLVLWLPGFILGASIHFAVQKINKPYTIPALMLFASALFYSVVWGMHISLDQLRAAGWLLDSSVSGGVWQFPLSADLLSQVDWAVLRAYIPALIPVSIMSVIALLLNSSGLELIVKKDFNLNRELIAAGAANLAAGMMGGLTGYQDVSFSTLNYTMSGGKRLVGVITALLLGATLFAGASVILYIPKFVFGSVLIFLGIELLIEWIYEAWFKFSRGDFLVIITILLVVALSGFLQGIIAGLVLAVGMFAVSYSQVSVIKFALTGREYHSRVTRSPQEQELIEIYGDQIRILKLEGFIFFGTANGIFMRVRELIGPQADRIVKFVLLDFSKVSGVDSTGMLSFARMMQWSREEGLTLILTGLTGHTQDQFLHENSKFAGDEAIHFFVDLDHGLEWCENEIVYKHLADTQITTGFAGQMAVMENLLPFFQRHEYDSGDYLIKEGDAPDLMYFIESGQVTAQLESPGKKPVRFETMYGGRTVGEIGFYLEIRRTASVVVDRPSIVYSLSKEDLKRMETEAPEFANMFHRMLVILLSERTAHLSRTIGALERS